MPRFTILASLCALIAVLAPASAADGSVRAAPPSTISVEPGKTGDATATCPAGTRVVSGGFESPDFDDRNSVVVRYGSTRSTRGSWGIGAAGLGGQEAGRMTAYAYCERPDLRIRVRSATTTVPSNNFASVVAECAPGERAIAGGFGSPGFSLNGQHVIPLTSKRAGKRAWRVDGINPSFDDSMPTPDGVLSAYAYCREAGGPRVFARASTADTPAASGEDGTKGSVTLDTYCPQGSTAISGGFDGNLAASDQGLTASGALSSYRLPLGIGWRTNAISVSETAATVTGYVYCQAAPKG